MSKFQAHNHTRKMKRVITWEGIALSLLDIRQANATLRHLRFRKREGSHSEGLIYILLKHPRDSSTSSKPISFTFPQLKKKILYVILANVGKSITPKKGRIVNIMFTIRPFYGVLLKRAILKSPPCICKILSLPSVLPFQDHVWA